MRLTVEVEHAGGGICSHAARTVPMADAFDGDALFEISVKRERGGGVSRSLEHIDPAIFQALEDSTLFGVYES